MSAQIIGRRLLLGGAVGALALTAPRAQADTSFTNFRFAATGAPNARTMPDRLAEIINVKDYGALGDGTTDDTAAIQAAFDAAFGPVSAPHGGILPDGPPLNRPVFFPNGCYITRAPLKLHSVCGAHIYGAGRLTTAIQNTNASDPSVIVTDGINFSRIELIQFYAAAGGVCFDLNWHQTKSDTVSLQSITFSDVQFSGGDYGLRVGYVGDQGDTISLYNCFFGGQAIVGLSAWNYNALSICVYGGNISQCAKGIWCKAGSIPVISGVGFQENSVVDVHIESGAQDSYLISGCRTESVNFLESQPDCMVNVVGCTQMNNSPGYFVYATGSQTNLIGCYSRNGQVHGSSKLTVQNCRFDRSDWNAWYGSVSGDLFAIKGMSLTTRHAPTAGAESGTQYDNTGAMGKVDFTLPVHGSTTDRIPVGTTFSFYVTDKQIFKIIAGNGSTIRIGGSVSSSGGSASSSTVGDFLELVCLVQGGTSWGARSTIGTWTLA